jgi:hypothetical protein
VSFGGEYPLGAPSKGSRSKNIEERSCEAAAGNELAAILKARLCVQTAILSTRIHLFSFTYFSAPVRRGIRRVVKGIGEERESRRRR